MSASSVEAPSTKKCSELAEHHDDDSMPLILRSSVFFRLWPPERAVMGLLVCRHMRRKLLCHVDHVLLVKKKQTRINEDALAVFLGRVSSPTVSLRWEGKGSSLLAAASQSGIGSSLRMLSLRKSVLGDEGARRLSEVLAENDQLTSLSLRDCKIGPIGVVKVCEILAHCRHLQHLDLGDNRLGSQGGAKLGEACVACADLTHLDLSGNQIGAPDPSSLQIRLTNDGAVGIARLLRQCSGLEQLSLRSNFLGPEGMAAVAQGLRSCTMLTHVDLAGNDIGQGVASLRGALSWASLTHLDLSSNRLDGHASQLDLRDGAIGAFNAGGAMPALTYLNLSGNFPGEFSGYDVVCCSPPKQLRGRLAQFPALKCAPC